MLPANCRVKDIEYIHIRYIIYKSLSDTGLS